jgi:hypothetical protein
MSAVISLMLNTWMNVALLGLDLDHWVTFLSTGSLRITTWWIFPCTVASLLGSKGMASRWVAFDRFLLSEEWCLDWPNCKQVARLRGLSDHCALVLSANEEDWGLRPSRMLKCGRDIHGNHLFVRDKWKSFQVAGWGGYVLKEKL